MGQKVSPISFRTGITIGWKSRWFAPKGSYGEFLVEDERIRRFIDKRLNRQPPYAAISGIEIERTREEVKLIIRTARPGLVIGPKGAEVDKLKDALEDLTDRRVNISIVEIRNPDLDAQLVAEGISEQLRRRSSFRRTMKQRTDSTMQAGAKGVKITISGRLGGLEMSRSETQLRGSIPLHTLEANVDYGFATSFTTYGTIGVKVWIYRGMFGEEPAEAERPAAGMTRARRRREHTGERPGERQGGRQGGRPAVGGPSGKKRKARPARAPRKTSKPKADTESPASTNDPAPEASSPPPTAKSPQPPAPPQEPPAPEASQQDQDS